MARALDAMQTGYETGMEAKCSEVGMLRGELEKALEQARYERQRADALVDRLLERDARVAAVAPEARALADAKTVQSVKTVEKLFDEINLAGEDLPDRIAEPQITEFAGGGKGGIDLSGPAARTTPEPAAMH